MRVSLDPDPGALAKQVAQLRAFLNRQEAGGGQAAVSARMQTVSFLPFLAALRAELRDEVMPELVMTAVSDLLANIAVTAVQSLLDAPAVVIEDTTEQLLKQATITAVASIQREVEATRPTLKVVPKLDPGSPQAATILHMPTKGSGNAKG